MEEKLLKEIQELKLKIQALEEKLEKLENGEFGTGVYLAGCTETNANYITSKPMTGKEGE